MKRRLMKTFFVAIVLVVAAAVVAPYFVGRSAETHFKALVAHYNAQNSGFVVKVDSYHRGFYSSEATLSVKPLAGMSERGLRIWSLLLGRQGTPTFKLRINHGPIAWAAFGQGHISFVPVLYTAEFRGDELPPMSILGIFKPEMYSKTYFDGTRHTTVTVPPGRYSMGVFGVTWKGAHLQVDGNGAYTRMKYRLSIDPVHYQAQNVKTGDTYSGEIKGLKFSGKRTLAAHDFWVGRGQSHFEGGEFKTNGKRTVLLQQGQGNSTLTETSNGRWLNSSGELAQAGGTIKGWPFSRLDIGASVVHVDAGAMRSLLNRMRSQAGSAEDQAASLEKMSPLLGQVFNSAQAKVSLELDAPDGSLNANAKVVLDQPAPPSASAMQPSQALLKRINVVADLDFDRKLVDSFSKYVLGGEQAQKSVDQVLDEWINEGLLKPGKPGRYKSDITYRQGVLTINGHVMNGSAGKGGTTK